MSLYRGDCERNVGRCGGNCGEYCYICVGAGVLAGTSRRPDRGGYCRDGRTTVLRAGRISSKSEVSRSRGFALSEAK